MIVDIKRIGAQGLTLQNRVAVDGNLLLEDDSYFLEELQYSVHFSRDGEQIKVRGNVKTTLSLRCVSCLESFQNIIDSNFDIILFPAKQLTEKNTILGPEEMEYIFFERDEIDLEKLLMEQVNLNIPFNPTCRPQCKGICPGCGVNLNEETCHCEHPVNGISIFFDKIKR